MASKMSPGEVPHGSVDCSHISPVIAVPVIRGMLDLNQPTNLLVVCPRILSGISQIPRIFQLIHSLT